jgi:DNA-binding beta-propeller fold protein YncE
LYAFVVVFLFALVVLSFAFSASAFAGAQREHVFSFSFGSKGSGEGQFSDPSGVAVSDVTGDVYVADRKHGRVEQFKPVLKGGLLVGEAFVRSFTVSAPEGVVVDNSTEGEDPSRDDVYVLSGSKVVYKFSAEGVAIMGGEGAVALKKFELEGVKRKLEGVEGLAVDQAGSLSVYQQNGVIYTFSDALANEVQSGLAVDAGLTGERGFALDSHDDFYVGVLSEGGFPVMSKLEGLTGQTLIAALDEEATTAVTVNSRDDSEVTAVDERDDIYVTNVTSTDGEASTTVAELAPETEGQPGSLIQRFGAPGLKEGDAIAVDGRNGTVFVPDAAANDVDVFELELPGPPIVEDVSVATTEPAVANARRLSGEINPTGSDTHYYFEYGVDICATVPSPCTRSPASPGDLGAGVNEQEVSLQLIGLSAGTYHYRLVAENTIGMTHSVEQTFTIVAVASGLPDGRAWEMVSPHDKHGAPIEALTNRGGLILAAVDGNALTYVANGAIAEEAPGNRSPEPQQVLATRGAEGWNSQDIATPQTAAQGFPGHAPEYRFFSPDLSLSLVEPWVDGAMAEPPLAPPSSQAEAGHQEKTIYLRDDQPLAPGASEQQAYAGAEANSGFLAPGYLPLLTAANVPPGTSFGGELALEFLGATPDLSHVVLHASVTLTESSSTEPSPGPGLYEWSGDELRFVSELPSGASAPEATLGYAHVTARALSSDGTRIVWTDHGSSPGHLYIRDTATGTTVQLDKAVEGVEEPTTGSARFQAASSDGSRVFFTDTQKLTPGATAEPANEEADLYADLYVYECKAGEAPGGSGCTLTDLTAGVAGTGEHAAVQGFILGASEDGASVYLVAQGVLTDNANGGREKAEAGADDLYELRREGGKWTTMFVAVLSGADNPDWDAKSAFTTIKPGDTADQTARVSPNGRYLAFMSRESLTGYDNRDALSGEADE